MKGFSTLKILATVKLEGEDVRRPYSFSTLKILATVKPYISGWSYALRFSTLKILLIVSRILIVLLIHNFIFYNN